MSEDAVDDDDESKVSSTSIKTIQFIYEVMPQEGYYPKGKKTMTGESLPRREIILVNSNHYKQFVRSNVCFTQTASK